MQLSDHLDYLTIVGKKYSSDFIKFGANLFNIYVFKSIIIESNFVSKNGEIP